MGANRYFYFTPWQADVQAALNALREQEFQAGRYDPGFHAKTGVWMFEFSFPPETTSPSPGPAHETIEQALEASGESAEGTRSILDILNATDVPFEVAEVPMMASDYGERFCKSAPLTSAELLKLFQTEQPSRQHLQSEVIDVEPDEDLMAALENAQSDPVVIQQAMSGAIGNVFWDSIDRGQARHIVVYENGLPKEYFFGGMSFD